MFKESFEEKGIDMPRLPPTEEEKKKMYIKEMEEETKKREAIDLEQLKLANVLGMAKIEQMKGQLRSINGST